ncbi:hypothetical protein H310_07528 [Aphanomyces invadans]|uniref:Uncharacterized protein n=1 Tax=Aphanomyces invadans TaxID=157072 RepID=A0A024U2H6_9STRA|nr:hypothetical protein H310_07528 [Aphanomyces invadans]ETW00112.1 hypothetical protein H310_07528 [Aphanomyces invadans]|eukprot:XP_008871137.1 hypothetical protein H310_07528 [Aphanomyces invadans]
MLHVDLNDDLAEYVDVAFASGDNVVVVVVSQREMQQPSAVHTALANLPQQVLYRQQSMATIEEDAEFHSFTPLLRSTTHLGAASSMGRENSADHGGHDLDIEGEEYYTSIVKSFPMHPLEHFMPNQYDSEDSESVVDSEASSDVSVSSATNDVDDAACLEGMQPADDFHRVFAWLQEHHGWTRQPGLWGGLS